MKKILITGGTSGIGYSMLRKFHEKDCMIYFTYSKNKYLAKKIEKKYKNTKSINLNLNSKSSINKLSKNIKDKLDCIILNAAQTLFVEKKNFRKFTPELFEKYVNVNLISQYRIFFNLLDKINTNSNVIFISSIASKNGIGSNVAYSAAKAGLNNLSISLSKIFGKKFQINCIAPGLMRTKFTSKFGKNYFKKNEIKTSTNKLSTPENISEVAYSVFSNFKNFTGQTIYVDGGSS